MSTISNRFFVTALEDGTTLHGSMRSTVGLTQAWNNGAAIPDWTKGTQSPYSNCPIVYITLLDGANYVVPTSGTWFYNGVAITWGNNNISTDGNFERLNNYTAPGYTSGTYVPAIRIIRNLASSSNVDQDLISYSGMREISGAQIPFSAQLDVRITQYVTGGYLGVLSFAGGVADITQQNDRVTIQADLYSDAKIADNDFTTRWYINDEQVQADGNSLTVTEPEVVDYATVKCEFIHEAKTVYTAYIGVDDTQDPEYMYIFLGSQSGSSASLRQNESAQFKVWIGKADDPTVDVSWTDFKVMLLDSEGDPILTPVGSETISDGYHVMTNVGTPFEYATITIPYAYAYSHGKNITGIIKASKV